MSRPLHEIAAEIKTAWPNPYFGAVPYIDAMRQLVSADDNYGYSDGREIVIYFLSNAATFRGAEARAIKTELKALL